MIEKIIILEKKKDNLDRSYYDNFNESLLDRSWKWSRKDCENLIYEHYKNKRIV